MSRSNWAKALLVSIASIVVVSSCSSTTPPIDDDGPLAIAASPRGFDGDAVDASITEGTLAIESGCVTLVDDAGDRYGILWLADDVRWLAASSSIAYQTNFDREALVLTDGTRIGLGGHQTPAGYELGPEEFLQADGCEVDAYLRFSTIEIRP